MSAIRPLRLAGIVLASVPLLAGALVVACSSSNSNPTPTYTLDGGDSSVAVDSGGSDSSPSNEGSPADASGDTTQDATEDVTGETGDDAPADAPVVDAAACTSDAGCWSCAPTTTTQFLNQCTSSTCSPFDNLQRLPNYDGGLPPLQ